eukprot:CAMPEP_0119330782 /NCGR_PEP_ID=MMETSP1333-20130426/79023_1 /TAXON_ID=418940 /ORGANISM="Scyphosphaera apsteinii, Strain RCC1455" /LENGTH=349 /DNA_ID=CAMNT_0007340237 /DNA_START=17 /DNA_END=1066 /DNA_ORIENTATION=+
MSWRSWDTYSLEHRSALGGVAHFHQLNGSAYKVWVPKKRRSRVCVVSMYSQDLLQPGAWGRYAMEMNLNWAFSHGYKFTIFQERLANPQQSYGWSLPRSVLFMLEQGPHECEWVFSMDGDAVVNNVTASVEPLIKQFFSGSATQMLMTCHWHIGLNGDCHNCRCTRARKVKHCSEKKTLFEYGRNSHCAPNMGVYIVKNTPKAWELMRWWAGAGGGRCSLRGDRASEKERGLGAQKCSLRLKARWPGLIDVVNARVMNMPAWFNEHVHGMRVIPLVPQPWIKSLAKQMSCFESLVFICHALGFHNNIDRTNIFRAVLEKREPALRAALLAAGEIYVSVRHFPTNITDWW